jgi:hypothetical protein
MAKKGKIKQTSTESQESRPIRWRGYAQFFLIVCEDEATEPAYFQQFKAIFDELRPETIYLEAVGTGKDPKGVVEHAIEERKRLKTEANKEIDFVWAVFDKDDADQNVTKIQRFEDAFAIAKTENIHLAYSNEVFELWLLLHLEKVEASSPIPRQEIYARLENAIQIQGNKYENFVYDHKKFNPQVIAIIAEIGNETHAIEKAEKLLEAQQGKKPIEANPSTRVHLLVKELRAWIAYYSYN